ncbi:MAG: hypothetical protein KF784_10550 [Fimbriimonadaceae bacterium]|nr:hypothetical protein [Fimbriimonadaceae bacterium]
MRFVLGCFAALAVVGCSKPSGSPSPSEPPPDVSAGQSPVKSALSEAQQTKYVGSYSMTTSKAGSPDRTITLTLNSDQTFTLKFVYEGKGDVPAFKGNWALNGDLVEALVTVPPGTEDRYVFVLDGDSLKAVEYNKSEYGEQGLTLVRHPR